MRAWGQADDPAERIGRLHRFPGLHFVIEGIGIEPFDGHCRARAVVFRGSPRQRGIAGKLDQREIGWRYQAGDEIPSAGSQSVHGAREGNLHRLAVEQGSSRHFELQAVARSVSDILPGDGGGQRGDLSVLIDDREHGHRRFIEYRVLILNEDVRIRSVGGGGSPDIDVAGAQGIGCGGGITGGCEFEGRRKQRVLLVRIEAWQRAVRLVVELHVSVAGGIEVSLILPCAGEADESF